MKIHLLDVGNKIYGDCLLIEHGGRCILIDGAHVNDDDLILGQLHDLRGTASPIHIDLLIVTHCHADHIGCLPELVVNGDIEVDYALVADEQLGFGRVNGEDAALDVLPSPQRTLAIAMQEEDHTGLPDAAVAAFLSDVAKLDARYDSMLSKLSSGHLVRYGKDDAGVRQIEKAFADFGLVVLGPSLKQLRICANAIAENTKAASDAVSVAAADVAGIGADDTASLVDAYRAMMRPSASPSFAGDAFSKKGKGAKNDQSIVVKVEADGWKALLTGDMQFAAPEVDGLDDLVATLLATAKSQGPYDFIKTAHHTSYNGLDEDVFKVWSATTLFAHSGGKNDPNHPDSTALDVLREHHNDLTFARTDHNGLITVEKEGSNVTISKSKGRFNDFTVNQRRRAASDQLSDTLIGAGEDAAGPLSRERGQVEVTTRIPHVATRVSIDIEVAPAVTAARYSQPARSIVTSVRGKEAVTRVPPEENDGGGTILPAGVFRFAAGRGDLPKLLFVTHPGRLKLNIGESEAGQVLKAIGDAGQTIVNIPNSASSVKDAVGPVRAALRANKYDGVVILGGYDVVPPARLDVLDPATRARYAALPPDKRLNDPMIVWNDEAYADTDGDFLPDLPHTRIPDGRRSDVVFAALGANKPALPKKFGVYNVNRPFAKTVFPSVPGTEESFKASETFAPNNVGPGQAASAVYFMLHGADSIGVSYWGEVAAGGVCEAINAGVVPKSAPGAVVFTGCCYAGLTAGPAADLATASTSFRPRGPEASIAVAYLKAGATAFVGCTGSHYSPITEPFTFYGQPMHVAFWQRISHGISPAVALFEAKREYARGIPHDQHDTISLAIELKILRQYTCLGLGW